MQMEIVFKSFGTMTMRLGKEESLAYAQHILFPLYKVCEGFAGKVITGKFFSFRLSISLLFLGNMKKTPYISGIYRKAFIPFIPEINSVKKFGLAWLLLL